MTDIDLDQALSVAIDAATAAADVILAHYHRGVDVETKSDATPVTVADREAEQVIREVLNAAFPDHQVFGEEAGRGDGDPTHLWLVDPIDGTKSFVRGYGMFSTQIALMVDGELTLGVSSAPLAGELAWARRDGGAFVDGERVTVSDVDSVEAAAVSTGNLATLADSEGWARLGRILARADRTRGYGDYYHYHRLAAGHIDAVIESDVNILDIAALTVIVREAGGRITDLDGQPVGLDTRSVLAAPAALHATLLSALHDPSPKAP